MHNVYQTNRALCSDYYQILLETFAQKIQPEDFTPLENVDPQRFYLEYKNRLQPIVADEIKTLKDQVGTSANVHLILLKLTSLVDAAISKTLQIAIWFYNKQHSQNLNQANVPLALIARGGYGRGEMYFRSDIDAIILTKVPAPDLPSDCMTRILKYFEYLFVHQEIFPGPCNFKHCEIPAEGLEFEKEDPSVLCALTEHRFVSGNRLIYAEFSSAVKTAGLMSDEVVLNYCKGHRAYYEVQNTVFSQEPNVKEELLRLYWALFMEKVSHHLEKNNLFELLHELHQKNQISGTVFKALQNGFSFLVRVRLLLHCYQRGAHRDILSYEVREQVAEAMGFELHDFFREYYYNAAYPVKKHSRNLFWEALTQDTSETKTLAENFALNAENQIIFSKNGQGFLAQSPEAIFKILGWVSKDNYHLSFNVIKEIEKHAHEINPVFISEEQRQEINERFKLIIKGKYFAKSLRLLHEFGLLQDYCIPEFKEICGLLQDIYVHKFPTDIHILAALDKLNNLELNRGSDLFLVELYQSVKDRTALKLAVLLHDIGKGFKKSGQNEEMLGARMTGPILQNLGYDNSKSLESISFLVERHLTMRDLMLLDPEEDETYERVWDLVGHDKERLKMLILLTYADRGGTKMNMSSAEIEQLKNFYQYTLYHKKRRQVSNSVKLEFLKMIRLPRDIQMQLEVYNEFLHSKQRFAVEMIYRPGHLSDLIVCAPDAIGILHKIAVVLFFNRVNIADANIHTERGNILDLFKIYNAEEQVIEFSNFFYLQKQIKEELKRILVDNEPLVSVFKGRSMSGHLSATKYTTRKPKVKIIGRSVSIETPDMFGTFMMETKVFHDMRMEIHRAVLHTQIDSASNIFYLAQEDVNRIMQDETRFYLALEEALAFLHNPEHVPFEEAFGGTIKSY